MYRMVFYLTEIQRMAYQTASKRTSSDMLHYHVVTYQFGRLYSQIFANPEKLSVRKMFGAPFHCVVKHMPELYRCVSLRSIVAEASERVFHDIRHDSTQFNFVNNLIFNVKQ
jgi:hypothetical protein